MDDRRHIQPTINIKLRGSQGDAFRVAKYFPSTVGILRFLASWCSQYYFIRLHSNADNPYKLIVVLESAQEHPGAPRSAQEFQERPGASRSAPERPVAPRSAQEGPRAPRSTQERPGAARSAQERPGAPRSAQAQSPPPPPWGLLGVCFWFAQALLGSRLER